MTTTFDHQKFYAELNEAISIAFKNKIALYHMLSSKPENINRREALIDILTIFSLGETVTLLDDDSSSIEININTMIKDFYTHVGNEAIVGVTPSDVAKKELDDLVFNILPKFKLEFFKEFNDNLKTDQKTTQAIDSCQSEVQVLISVLTVIKSEMMYLQLIDTSKVKKKENQNNVG